MSKGISSMLLATKNDWLADSRVRDPVHKTVGVLPVSRLSAALALRVKRQISSMICVDVKRLSARMGSMFASSTAGAKTCRSSGFKGMAKRPNHKALVAMRRSFPRFSVTA